MHRVQSRIPNTIHSRTVANTNSTGSTSQRTVGTAVAARSAIRVNASRALQGHKGTRRASLQLYRPVPDASRRRTPQLPTTQQQQANTARPHREDGRWVQPPLCSPDQHEPREPRCEHRACGRGLRSAAVNQRRERAPRAETRDREQSMRCAATRESRQRTGRVVVARSLSQRGRTNRVKLCLRHPAHARFGLG